jgi:hypothetical protein
MLHRDLVASDGIHCIHHWEVASAVARGALVLSSTDVGKVCRQLDTGKFYLLEDDTPATWVQIGSGATDLAISDAGNYFTVDNVNAALQELGKAWANDSLTVAASDETTALTVGEAKLTFRWVGDFTLSAIRATVNTSQATGALFTVNVLKNGVTFFSTLLTIDNGETTSKTAATPAVLSTTAIADDDIIRVDITQVGATTVTGLKISFLGKKI